MSRFVHDDSRFSIIAPYINWKCRQNADDWTLKRERERGKEREGKRERDRSEKWSKIGNQYSHVVAIAFHQCSIGGKFNRDLFLVCETDIFFHSQLEFRVFDHKCAISLWIETEISP